MGVPLGAALAVCDGIGGSAASVVGGVKVKTSIEAGVAAGDIADWLSGDCRAACVGETGCVMMEAGLVTRLGAVGSVEAARAPLLGFSKSPTLEQNPSSIEEEAIIAGIEAFLAASKQESAALSKASGVHLSVPE